MEEEDENYTLKKGDIINQASLDWCDKCKDLLKDENLQIMNAQIYFTSFEELLKNLKISKSIQKSLKKIDLYVDDDSYDSVNNEVLKFSEQTNKLISLVEPLSK